MRDKRDRKRAEQRGRSPNAEKRRRNRRVEKKRRAERAAIKAAEAAIKAGAK